MKKMTGCFYWIAIAMVTFVLSTAGIAQGQVFQVQGEKSLDFQGILQNHPNGGSVAIRARLVIPAGNPRTPVGVQAEILTELPRSGESALWNDVRNIVSTWTFPSGSINPGTANYIDYDFYIPGGTNIGEEPYIQINAAALSLSQGFTLDQTHPEHLVRVSNIDRSDIILTQMPPQFMAKKGKGIFQEVVNIIQQLGMFFEVVFLFILLLFIYYAWRSTNKGLARWYRESAAKKGLMHKKVLLTDEEKQSENYKEIEEKYKNSLYSREAKEIRDAWEEGIGLSQLPEDVDAIFKDKIEITKARNFVEFIKGKLPTFKSTKHLREEMQVIGFWNVFVKEADFFRASGEKVPQSDTSDEMEKIRGEIEKALREKDNERFEALSDQLTALMKSQAKEEISEEYFPLEKVVEDLQIRGKVVEKLINLKESPTKWLSMERDMKDALKDFVWNFFAKPKIIDALEKSKKIVNDPLEKNKDLFEVFVAGLSNHLVNRNEWWASQEVDRAIDRIMAIKLEDRKSPLDGLWAIGSISTMIGLFGTVYGISKAFQKIGGMTNIKFLMSKLASQINIALSTTIVGLVIGILAVLTYYIYKSMIEKKGLIIEGFFTDITNKI